MVTVSTVLVAVISVASALVALAAIYLMLKIVSLITSLRAESKFRLANSVVERIVIASEQLSRAGLMPAAGSEKKNMAVHFLNEELNLGYKPDFIDKLIEAAVLDNVSWFEPDKSAKEEAQPSMKD